MMTGRHQIHHLLVMARYLLFHHLLSVLDTVPHPLRHNIFKMDACDTFRGEFAITDPRHGHALWEPDLGGYMIL
jgi:hypothetical protein